MKCNIDISLNIGQVAIAVAICYASYMGYSAFVYTEEAAISFFQWITQ